MQKFRPVIREQKTMEEFTQCIFPTFLECKIDENYLQTYFGYIEKMQERKIPLLEKNVIPDPDSGRKVLEVPSVSSVIDTGFPAEEEYNTRLYDMGVTDDQRVWMGGASRELKLFDLQGHLHHTVTITCIGLSRLRRSIQSGPIQQFWNRAPGNPVRLPVSTSVSAGQVHRREY